MRKLIGASVLALSVALSVPLQAGEVDNPGFMPTPTPTPQPFSTTGSTSSTGETLIIPEWTQEVLYLIATR